jgi:dihydroxyacetone kinase-like protein
MTQGPSFFQDWLHAFADRISDNKKHLTKLDSAIGDGDHGQNMNRGLQAAIEKVGTVEDVKAAFRDAAMAIISKTGGASGPLYGTFFMEAGKAAPGNEISLADFAAMMQAGLDGVQRRGKAELEDKTMVDAMVPAVKALQNAADAGDDWPTALRAAADAAHEGMKATTPLVARKGRASYLGERSAGHQDPGATSTHLLFDAAAEAVES